MNKVLGSSVNSVLFTFRRQLHKNPRPGFVQWCQGFFSRKEKEEGYYDHVIQIGDPNLRNISKPVHEDTIHDPRFQDITKRLRRVLEKYDNIGMSAIQIGIPCQMFVMQLTQKQLKANPLNFVEEGGMTEIPFQVLINPRVEVTDSQVLVAREACASIHGFSALVPRYKEVQMMALNEKGEKVSFKARNWTARVIQHEIDHLQGRLYTDIMNRDTFIFNHWRAVNDRRGKVWLRYDGS